MFGQFGFAAFNYIRNSEKALLAQFCFFFIENALFDEHETKNRKILRFFGWSC